MMCVIAFATWTVMNDVCQKIQLLWHPKAASISCSEPLTLSSQTFCNSARAAKDSGRNRSTFAFLSGCQKHIGS